MQTNGFVFGLSDLATVDQNFPQPSSYLYVSGSGGDIVFMNTAGNAQYFPDAQANIMYPIGAVRILSSAVVNGVSRTTTATEIAYCSSYNK